MIQEGQLIYCNGDSYSDENFDPCLKSKTYAHTIGSHLNIVTVNKARSGSCNRRIIRTTIHDILMHRKQYPKQKIIVLLGLSFEVRSEIWIDGRKIADAPEESSFATNQFSDDINDDWKSKLLKNQPINFESWLSGVNDKFYKKYCDGRAFFYSPYAERINLLCDIIMIRKFFESLNIGFLIFQSPKAEKLGGEYLLDQFKTEIENDDRIFDLENFGFCDWCYLQNFLPLYDDESPEIAHYGPDAHEAFAKEVLLPKLLATNQIAL